MGGNMFLKPSQYVNNPKHFGSLELKREIEFYENSPIPFSKKYGWDRWGVLGVLSDYVLQWLNGNIIEIGIGESSYYFTYLAKKYNRKVFHCDIQKSDYENLCTVDGFFDDSNVLFHGASDDFFRIIEFPRISLVFIDGDHMYNQVKKDFKNALSLIEDNGFIFFHDMYPENEMETSENRSGTGYILRKELERRSDVDVFTFPFGSWNAGLTMVRKIPDDINKYRESGRKYNGVKEL